MISMKRAQAHRARSFKARAAVVHRPTAATISGPAVETGKARLFNLSLVEKPLGLPDGVNPGIGAADSVRPDCNFSRQSRVMT